MVLSYVEKNDDGTCTLHLNGEGGIIRNAHSNGALRDLKSQELSYFCPKESFSKEINFNIKDRAFTILFSLYASGRWTSTILEEPYSYWYFDHMHPHRWIYLNEEFTITYDSHEKKEN